MGGSDVTTRKIPSAWTKGTSVRGNVPIRHILTGNDYQFYVNVVLSVKTLTPILMFLGLLLFIIWFHARHTLTGHLYQVLLSTRQATNGNKNEAKHLCCTNLI